MRSADRRRAGLLVVAMAALAIPSLAQDRQRPSEVEAAVRRRAESWLRERAQKRLACRMCDCVADRVQWCGDCDRTGVDPKRLERSLARFVRPGARENAASWARKVLQEQRGQWGGQPYAREGLEVVDVLVTRDVAWSTSRPEGDERRPTADAWVREAGNYHLLLRGALPSEPLLEHEWFVVGSFSAFRLFRHVTDLVAAEAEAGITDLERDRRRRGREEAECALVGRVVADFGRVLNVAREPAPHASEGQPDVFYVVTVQAGSSRLLLSLVPGAGRRPRRLRDTSRSPVPDRVRHLLPGAHTRLAAQRHGRRLRLRPAPGRGGTEGRVGRGLMTNSPRT